MKYLRLYENFNDIDAIWGKSPEKFTFGKKQIDIDVMSKLKNELQSKVNGVSNYIKSVKSDDF